MNPAFVMQLIFRCVALLYCITCCYKIIFDCLIFLFKPRGFVVSTALLSLLSADVAAPSCESCLRHDPCLRDTVRQGTERGDLLRQLVESAKERFVGRHRKLNTKATPHSCASNRFIFLR